MSSQLDGRVDDGPQLLHSSLTHPVAHASFFSPVAVDDQAGSQSPGPEVLTLRALVSTKDAGVIIGKGGKNVADLREGTGVKAGVSKVVPGVHERVLTVSGSVEGVAKVRPLLLSW